MADLLARQLGQLAFAVVTGRHRLTPEQRSALADLNAAASVWAQAEACVLKPQLRAVEPTKEPA